MAMTSGSTNTSTTQQHSEKDESGATTTVEDFEKDDGNQPLVAFDCDLLRSTAPESEEEPPEAEPCGSSSESSQDDGQLGETEIPEFVLNQHDKSTAAAALPAMEDPYGDVRARLEELSQQDRDKYARHSCQIGAVHEDLVVPAVAAFSTYLAYAILISCGRVRDLFSSLFGGRYVRQKTDIPSDDQEHYAPLLNGWENFFTRRLYHRIQDCFNKPVASNPGAHIHVLERVSTDGNKSMEILGPLDNLDTDEQRQEYEQGEHFVQLPDDRVARRCLNLGSYNYLGFADDWGKTCRKDVMACLENFSVSTSASRSEYGTTALHRELEKTVAKFLGKEDSIVLTMGFNTNASTIPALVGRGDLILSDELNHTSIVNGARASGAAIRVFRHNDSAHLEGILREAIIKGRPRTRRPWRRVLVIVEGVYSMEGEYCDLRSIVAVCKKYGAYIYLDEAHSIGAVGPTGRGICEYAGVDTADIDVMMGTFSKSFGGMGGYIATSKAIIKLLRRRCSGSACHNALSPVVCQQVITSFKVIMGEDGTNIGRQKIQALRDNSNYMRMRLNEMGMLVLGHYDSPVMPVMLYNPSRMAAFSRECMKRGLAVVVVGFPAVPLLMSRARFCMSAGHTRQDLDRALKEIKEIANIVGVRYNASDVADLK